MRIISLFLLFVIAFGCNSTSGVFKKKRIFVSGLVTYKGEGSPVVGATVMIKGTEIHYFAANNGYYKLDVTNVVDTAKTLTVFATFANAKPVETLLNFKLKKSYTLNIQLKYGANWESEKITIEKK